MKNQITVKSGSTKLGLTVSKSQLPAMLIGLGTGSVIAGLLMLSLKK